jgi:serine/threonine protein kinase
MDGTRQYMAPENIVRPIEERISEDLRETDLSKVDTFALGVILVNMLTGGYLFESCLAEEYNSLVNNFDLLVSVLGQKLPQI